MVLYNIMHYALHTSWPFLLHTVYPPPPLRNTLNSRLTSKLLVTVVACVHCYITNCVSEEINAYSNAYVLLDLFFQLLFRCHLICYVSPVPDGESMYSGSLSGPIISVLFLCIYVTSDRKCFWGGYTEPRNGMNADCKRVATGQLSQHIGEKK
jgi:hypothetical protein